jgi:hypothetical protein
LDLTNIKPNQVIKNYKHLCQLLNVPELTSNSKKAQLKELSRYCNFNKLGHSFTILEVYDIPLKKIDNRGGNNSIYNDLIQILIMDLLAQCPHGHVSISRSKLLLTINMINSNYSKGNEYVPLLSKYTNINERTIYDFYNTSNSNFKSTIETALNKLMDKRIIIHERVIKICECGTHRHRRATEEEKSIIAENEKMILDKYGFSEVSQIRCSRYWKNFKKEVKQLLNEKGKIEYYYHAYDITINKKYIHDERKTMSDLLLKDIQRMEYKEELNLTVYYHIIENAQKRHGKGLVSGKMAKVRSNKEYIKHIKKLAELLIDDNTSYIIDELKGMEFDEVSDIELLKELDYLFE